MLCQNRQNSFAVHSFFMLRPKVSVCCHLIFWNNPDNVSSAGKFAKRFFGFVVLDGFNARLNPRKFQIYRNILACVAHIRNLPHITAAL